MDLAFGARSVVGRPAKTTCGHVAAGTSGTPSIPEEYAPPVFISGPQPNVCPAPAGRRIPIGIRIEVFAQATVPALVPQGRRKRLCVTTGHDGDALARRACFINHHN